MLRTTAARRSNSRPSPVFTRSSPPRARGRRLAGLDETRLVSQHDRLHTVAQVELREDAGQMRLDRGFGQEESRRDLGVGEATRDWARTSSSRSDPSALHRPALRCRWRRRTRTLSGTRAVACCDNKQPASLSAPVVQRYVLVKVAALETVPAAVVTLILPVVAVLATLALSWVGET